MYLNRIEKVVSSGKIGLTDIEQEPWLVPLKIVSWRANLEEKSWPFRKARWMFFCKWQLHNSIICPIYRYWCTSKPEGTQLLLWLMPNLRDLFQYCRPLWQKHTDVSLVVLIHETGRQIWIKPIPVFSTPVRTYRRHPQLITTSIHHNSQELTWCPEF